MISFVVSLIGVEVCSVLCAIGSIRVRPRSYTSGLVLRVHAPPPSSPPSKKHECGIPNATLKEINTHRVHDLYSCDYFLTLYRSTSITFFGSS